MKRIAVALALLAAPALAQQPPAQVSLEYFQQRLMQTDMLAAQLMFERDEARAALAKLRAEKAKEPTPKKD